MSYILDALRRADADRERGPARGIHAQPLHAAAQARNGKPWAIVLGAGIGLGLVTAGVLWMRADDAPVPVAAAPAAGPVAGVQPLTPAPVRQPPTVPPLTPMTPAMAPPAPVPPPPLAALPPAPPPAAPAPAPAAPRNLQQPSAAGNARPMAPAGPGGRSPAASGVAGAAAVPSAAVPGAVAPGVSAPGPAAAPSTQLPPDMPKLAISGGVYSENPTQRMLIVGGQVMNEGSEVAPGVVLEQIRPRAAVLRFRDQRFTVGY